MLCTVYVLRNKINNKVYVGQTWETLRERMRKYDKKCCYLFPALNKYGKNNFYHEILTFCSTQETADYWEKHFIEKFKSDNRNFGYNIAPGGWRGKLSKESREKLSKSLKGKHCHQPTEFKNGHAGITTPRKLSLEKAQEIRKEFSNGVSRKKLTEKYNVSNTMVGYIIHNKQWLEK